MVPKPSGREPAKVGEGVSAIRQEVMYRESLVRELRLHPGAVVFRHEDILTAGIPDISITCWRSTLWVEAKDIAGELTAGQLWNLRLLSRVGYALVVVFGTKVIWVAHPNGEKLFAADAGQYKEAAGFLLSYLKERATSG